MSIKIMDLFFSSNNVLGKSKLSKGIPGFISLLLKFPTMNMLSMAWDDYQHLLRRRMRSSFLARLRHLRRMMLRIMKMGLSWWLMCLGLYRFISDWNSRGRFSLQLADMGASAVRRSRHGTQHSLHHKYSSSKYFSLGLDLNKMSSLLTIDSSSILLSNILK